MTVETRINEIYALSVDRNVYDQEFAHRHAASAGARDLKTKDMPREFYEFVRNYTCCDDLHLAMYMIYLLKLDGIKAYLAVTKEIDDQSTLHYAVVIHDEKKKKFFISDPGNDLRRNTLFERMAMSVKEFRKLCYKGRIRVYDMYGKHKDRCFFEDGYRKDCEVDLL